MAGICARLIFLSGFFRKSERLFAKIRARFPASGNGINAALLIAVLAAVHCFSICCLIALIISSSESVVLNWPPLSASKSLQV